MKILYVLEYYYPHIGGVERLFKALAEKQVQNGHEVMVVTNRYKRKLPKREIINGVDIRRLSLLNRFLFTFFSLGFVVNYARKFDLIHTTSFNAALPAYWAARLTGKKILITFHEAWGKLWFQLPFINPVSRRLFYLYERFILSLNFDQFIAVSDYTAKCLKDNGISVSKIKRIYNGINYPETIKEIKQPKDFVFTFFGRLGPSKGIDILMNAAVLFLQQHPESKMKLITSPEPPKIFRFLKKKIKKSALQDCIKIINHLSDNELRKEIMSSTCIVIPSASEGFCFAAVETIAFGVPVISSDMGALKEVVSGKFSKMKDYTSNSLFNSLKDAFDSHWQNKALKKFELSSCLSEYDSIYIRTLNADRKKV